MTPYQDPVRVHDCVQSVGYGEDSALGELLPYCLLDNSISPAGEEPVHQVTNGSLQPVLTSQRARKMYSNRSSYATYVVTRS